MTKDRMLGTLTFFTVLTACAPLQQAPLIYSSKTSIGIDLSTPTSEQPGISINIGFKQVDAAYVPVAVAKECDINKGSKNCEDAIYQVKDVTAYNNSDDSKLPDIRTAEAKNIFNQLTSYAAERDVAKTKLDEITQHAKGANPLIQAFDSNQDYKDSIGKTEAELSPGEKKARDDRAGIMKQDQEKIDKAERSYDEAQDNLAKYIRDPKVKNLAANLKLIASIDAKQDAYSVFGSFDGKAGADGKLDAQGKPTGEASLVVGKVFSTGVASQFLTQGLKALYAGKGNSACIAQAVALRQDFMQGLDTTKPDENRKKIAEFSVKLVAMCTQSPAPEAPPQT